MIISLKSNTFAEEIESLCCTKNIDYIDAVIHWCQSNNLEIEYAAELIKGNPVIKSKVQSEAENLNFLKRSSGRLEF